MTDEFTPRRYCLPFVLPAFWQGAAATRVEAYTDDPSMVNGRGIVRAQQIEAALIAGYALDQIDDFADWLRGYA